MANVGSRKWARGTIRITSTVMTTSEITRVLGLQPTDVFEKGSSAKTRNPKPAIRSVSAWLLESGLRSTVPIETHILTLLKQLAGRTAELNVLSRNCYIDMILGFASENGQGGFTIEHDVLAQLSELPISLSLDLYPPEGEHSDNEH